MSASIHILKVQQDGNDGIIVEFSVYTIAAYVVEELIELRPYREPINDPHASISRRDGITVCFPLRV